METFTIECIQENLNFEQINLIVKPNVMEICHYIDSRKVVNAADLTPTLISNFILEQTPLLFEVFQSMDNIPQYIRDKYIL